MRTAYQLHVLRATRDNATKIIRSCTNEQVNHTPTGFANNLIWNYGHMIVTQQLLIYGLSSLPMVTDRDLVAAYRKGSHPAERVGETEVEQLIGLADSTIGKLERDLDRDDLFKEFRSYTTSYGTVMNDHLEAVAFNNIHEGYHLGIMRAILKFV